MIKQEGTSKSGGTSLYELKETRGTKSYVQLATRGEARKYSNCADAATRTLVSFAEGELTERRRRCAIELAGAHKKRGRRDLVARAREDETVTAATGAEA